MTGAVAARESIMEGGGGQKGQEMTRRVLPENRHEKTAAQHPGGLRYEMKSKGRAKGWCMIKGTGTRRKPSRSLNRTGGFREKKRRLTESSI